MSSWIPNVYEAKGNVLGYDAEYLRHLMSDGRILLTKGCPVIFTLRHLAGLTDVPFVRLHDVVSRKVDPYRLFNIRKRGGGYRQIAIPDPYLMRVQRWINKNILIRTKAHTCSQAYMLGCSPIGNASIHSGAKWLVKVDIVRFFESVSERQVYRVFREIGYRSLLAFELTRLTTGFSEGSRKYKSKRWAESGSSRKISDYDSKNVGHLPQGAPTSPILANLVCRDMDSQISRLALGQGCTYTRYADDIVFSGSEFDRKRAVELLKKSSGILKNQGFKPNVQKSRIVTPGARKVVTGLLVNGPSPQLTREFRERIEIHLYYARKFGLAEHCRRRSFRSIIGFKEHLRGLVQYALQVNHDLGKHYDEEFRKLTWPIT